MSSSVRAIAATLSIVLISLLVACGGTSTQPISVKVASANSAIDQGQTVSITASVANDSKDGGVTWSVTGGGSLTNTTTTTATYNAPSSVTTAIAATITATSVSDTTKSATVQVKVNPLPAITTTTVNAATAGASYSATLAMSGGTSPFTWTVSPTSLPAGLSLNSGTGVISGTPTGGGSGSYTFKVVDATGASSTQALTITINAPPSLTITTSSLAASVVGTAYSQSVLVTGGVPSYTWSISSGSLPAGLNLNASTGAISGTPTGPQTGTIAFTVSVTDSQTPTHATQSANLSIALSAPALSVTTPSLPGDTLGTAYSQTLAATGGIIPYHWAISAGSLPAGLGLNASTGAITGTPTGSVTGPINFTVQATDAETPTAQTATKSLSITITAAPLSVVTSSPPTGVDGSSYSATLQAAGGVSPYTWTVTTGSLPTGLTLNASTGVISGSPTGSGATFTVTATDSETPTAQTATKQLTITVNPQLSVTPITLAAGTVGTSYSQTLAATGGITPYSWAVTTGSLPAGLSLNASTGAITGKPTGPQVGAISFTVTVTDSESPTKTATANLSITISAPPLSVTTQSLPGGTLGTSYSQTLAATGGITPYSWTISAGSLPAGLGLNANTGAITGTPTGSVTGPINFTVKVTDSESPAGTAAAALSITISAAPLSVVTSSLPTGVDGSSYSTTLQAAGGVSPYTWTVTTGSLPAGLLLNSTTGVISGSPTGSSATFTVTATDSETPTAQTATKQLTITVNPQLSVTPITLAAGTVGTSYSQTLAATGGITPYSWAVTTGSLPAGLSLNASTGAITGKPTGPQVGAISFTVTVTDSESPTKTATANLSIAISAPPLSVTTQSLAAGTLGAAYSATLAATGGITPYSWTISVGSLPAGLSLNGSTGAITGTPTGSVTGPINFTVKVTDSESPAGSATAALSITISAAPLSVVTSSLPTGVDGSSYSTTLQAAGGVSPYTWTVTTGSLPAGLLLNSTTGVISGSPTGSSATFTVTATDSETPTAQTATKQLTITVNPQLSVTPITLAAGTVGTSYSQTLAATGGITPYSWAVTTGSLPAGLSLNASTGAITGKPTGPQVGAISFTVTVTDSESPTKTATANLSITISAPPLTITTNSLSTGVLNQSYSQTVQATGGVTPYTWSISSGSLPAGLSINGSTGAITGTPTATGTSTFTVQVTDVETPTEQTATKNLSITINNSAPLQVTTTSMPAGVINTSYTNGFLAASGGIQPYTWSISSGSLPAGLTLNASTGQISGTPSAQGTSSFTAKVTDSSTPTESATAGLSITINASLTITTTSVPNGSVGNQYNATVNASGGLTPYSWSLTSGSLPPGLNLNNNNSLGISGQPTTTGTYPFTLLVTDNQGDTASQGYTIVITTQPVGYTVSGTVTYSGSKTGWTYLELYSNNCNGCNNNLGTSISEATLTSTGAFTIHGVLPGTYTLQAFMDNLGYGAENASNPTATVGNITVTNAGVTGVTVALVDPATVTISSSPTWKSNNGLGAFNGGAFVSFQTINNNNGIEMPSSYTVEWSTSASCSSSNPSKSFPAMGGNNPWIVNGLTNGTTYYFCARGVAGSSTGPWSAPSSGITIGAPSGGNAVSGKVTFSETAKGPLYVGFYNQSTGAVYADVVGSKTSPPTSPASYSVSVPTGSDYYFFGVLDQGNSGLISGPGQVSNTNGHNNTPVSITGTTTNENLTLPNASSIAYVMTQTQEQISPGGTNTNYTIGFNVNGLLKLPVGVELATGPNPGAVIPADVANGSFGGNSDQFGYWTSLNGATPNVGDSYTLNVTYSDATSEVLTVTVAAVLNNAFATSLSPQGTGVSVTPNFSWTDPTNASSYTYQFQLSDSNNNTIWQIPSNNSNSNGFSSSITSITWDVDPTNSGDLPNVSALNGNSTYYWQMQTSDTNGDSAQVQVTFQTAAAPLTLPTAGSLGSTVVGQGFSGAINASGGVGPNYTFAVNGVSVPTDGSQNVIADGIWVSSTGGNTLSIGGTPTAVQTVTLTNVTVTDSASNTAGPDTYTITVSAASPLSIETTTMPGATEGWAYNSYIKANGGVQPYTWSVTSGSSSLNAVNLTFNGSPSNNQGNAEISGTPSATGTPSFTVQVTDNDGNTASQPLTIAVTGCTNNSKLTGNYALLLQGWTDSSEGEVFAGLAGSFVANGSGTISSGVADFNDPSDGYTELTFTGTYCVAPNNQGLMTFNPPSGNPMFLAFSLQSSGNGNIITYQSGDGFQGSGVLLKQTTTAFALSKITGPYAMGLIGVDQSGNRFGVAGAFTASGTADWTSGELDANDNGNINGGNGTSSPISFSSNDVSTVDSTTGRGTVGIDVSGVGTLNFAYYEVNATQLLLVQTDAISGPGGSLFTGQILQQSGTFTAASLDGVGVMEAEGLDTGSSPATADAQAGFVTTNGTSSISVTLDDNDGGTMSSQTSSGTYSVAPNGRVTTSFTGENHPPIIYLTAKNQAILLGSNGKVSFGTMTPQVGSSFTVSSLDGNYLGGSEEPTNSNVKSSVIQIDADGNGNLTGTQYEVQNCGSGCWQPDSSAIPAGLTYAPASGGPAGKFDINQDGVPQVYLYMISTTQAVIMNVGSSSGGSCNDGCNPSLTDFHQ